MKTYEVTVKVLRKEDIEIEAADQYSARDIALRIPGVESVLDVIEAPQ